MPLSEQQQRQVVVAISVGCDLATAATLVELAPAELEAERNRDPAFAAELRKAAVQGELLHLRNVQQAARDEGLWRASAWWLERHAPERYAKGAAVSPRELDRVLAAVTALVARYLTEDGEREQFLGDLQALADNNFS